MIRNQMTYVLRKKIVAITTPVPLTTSTKLSTPIQQARLNWINDYIGILDSAHPLVKRTIDIAAACLKSLGLNPTDYQVVVADDDQINAGIYSADHEKVIQFNYGLLQFLDRNRILTEETIGFIIGHEIGHAIMSNTDKANKQDRHHSVTEEYLADRFGLKALNEDRVARTPFAGLDLMQALDAEFKADTMPTLTHPKTHRRTANLFHTIRTSYWKALSTPQTTLRLSDIPRTRRHKYDQELYNKKTPDEIYGFMINKASLFSEMQRACALTDHLHGGLEFPKNLVDSFYAKLESIFPELTSLSKQDRKVATDSLIVELGLYTPSGPIHERIFTKLTDQEAIAKDDILKHNWKSPHLFIKIMARCHKKDPHTYLNSHKEALAKAFYRDSTSPVRAQLTVENISLKEASESELRETLKSLLTDYNTFKKISTPHATVENSERAIASAILNELLKRCNSLEEVTQNLAQVMPHITPQNAEILHDVSVNGSEDFLKKARTFQELDLFIKQILHLEETRSVAVNLLAPLYQTALEKHLITPKQSTAHFNQLVSDYDLGTKGKYTHFEKKVGRKHYHINLVYITILDYVSLDEKVSLLPDTVHFHITPWDLYGYGGGPPQIYNYLRESSDSDYAATKSCIEYGFVPPLLYFGKLFFSP